jgi:hypothetical protein
MLISNIAEKVNGAMVDAFSTKRIEDILLTLEDKAT